MDFQQFCQVAGSMNMRMQGCFEINKPGDRGYGMFASFAGRAGATKFATLLQEHGVPSEIEDDTKEHGRGVRVVVKG